MTLPIRVPLAAVAIVVAACAVARPHAADALAGGLRARRAELAAADHQLSAAAHADARSIAASATDDVRFLAGAMRIVGGRGELASTLDSLSGHSLARLRWNAVRVDVSSDGGSGYTLGYGTREGPDGSVPVRYIAFWKRASEGHWSVAALALVRGSAATSTEAPHGCETPAAERALAFAPRSGETDGAPVIDADARFAARAAESGPGPAFLAFIADDGISLGGAGLMGCGPAALAHTFDGFAPGDLTWQPRFGYVAAGGDLGFTVGVAKIRGAAGTTTSKYLTIWKRQPDGGWRFVADGGSDAPPDA
jgi:ketosteroid isomerase-like protein